MKRIAAERYLQHDSIYVEGNEGWFTDNYRNELYQWNLDSEECRFITEIPVKAVNGDRNYRTCLKYGQEVFLFPGFADSLLVYHLETEEFTEIPLNFPHGIYPGITKCKRQGKMAWAVALGTKEIWKISLEEKKICHRYHLFENADCKCIAGEFSDNRIYVMASPGGLLCEFNISEETVTYRKVLELKEDIYTACFDGKRIWMSGKDRKFWRYDPEVDEIESVDFPAGKSEKYYKEEVNDLKWGYFFRSLFAGERVWFFGEYDGYDEIVYLDHDGTAKVLDKEWRIGSKGGRHAIDYLVDGKTIGVYYWDFNDRSQAAYLLEINVQDMSIRERHMYLTYEEIQKRIQKKLLKTNYLDEVFPFDARIFTHQAKWDKGEYVEHELTAGRNIFYGSFE